MRLIIQRVTHASVGIDGQTHAAIGPGFMVLVGVCHDDNKEDADWLAGKLCAMRIFGDDAGKMNLSVNDMNGELLIISQFTLFADTKKGNRPSFIRAAEPLKAKALYEYFVGVVASLSPGRVKTGIFAADMKVELLNDGPVTIVMDSKNRDF
jgi:D-tyrosyl-tRNA(Tyr) deacylase